MPLLVLHIHIECIHSIGLLCKHYSLIPSSVLLVFIFGFAYTFLLCLWLFCLLLLQFSDDDWKLFGHLQSCKNCVEIYAWPWNWLNGYMSWLWVIYWGNSYVRGHNDQHWTHLWNQNVTRVAPGNQGTHMSFWHFFH